MPARKKRPGKHGTIGSTSDPITPEERLLASIFGNPNLSLEDNVRIHRSIPEEDQALLRKELDDDHTNRSGGAS